MDRTLSLVVPSGRLTLGNLLGAIRQWVADQRGPDTLYGVADLHALTTLHDPERVRVLTAEQMMLLVAAGLDPGRCVLFVQSHVPAHAELHWLLEATASDGEFRRMIQYKQKAAAHGSVRAALLAYPVLMAADILLYGVGAVPVGDDQRQHVELDPPGLVRRKIARAVTDSGRDLVFDRSAKPGVANLLTILAACTGTTPERAAAGLASYRELKEACADAVITVLAPLQQRYAELTADPAAVSAVLEAGAARAREAAAPGLARAKAAIGLIPAA